MPVFVVLPIRLRLDPDAARSWLPEIEDALSTAAGRALGTARRAVLAEQGPDVTVTARPPRFSWSGAGLPAISPSTRTGLETALAAALRDAEARDTVARAGTGRPRAGVRGRLLRPAAPARDQTAPGRRPGWYVLAGDEPAPPPPESAGVLAIDHRTALATAWDGHVEQYGHRRWDPAAYGYPGCYGRIRLDDGTEFTGIVFYTRVRAVGDDGHPVDDTATFDGVRLSLLVVDDTNPFQPFTYAALPPVSGRYVLTSTGIPATEDNLVAELKHVVEAAGAAAPRAWRDPALAGAYAKHLAAEARRQLAADALIFRLEGGPYPRFFVLDARTPTPIRFVAGVSAAPVPASAGQAQTGGKGEWAERGRGGTAPADVPFLGEPALGALRTGAEAIRTRIERLAALLDVPAGEYAGQFCVNVASVLGARAHAAGLASVSAGVATTVAVQPEGTGNNGLLDVHPVDTAELRQLRILVGVLPAVSELWKAVVATYNERGNAGLFPRDAVASWAIRFQQEVTDVLDSSAADMFTEACRLILLQQLNSSREAIEARLATFDDVWRRFDAELNTGGKRVAQLQLLRRTLRTLRLSAAGATASVLGPVGYLAGPVKLRDYLAQARDVYTAITTADPAMFGSVLDARIERRGATTVAVWDGRDYSEEKLDEEIHRRRGVLNLMDPLFLQVEDLEPLVHRRLAGDETVTRAYVRQLLSELSAANDRVTRSTSDPADGAAFALGMSQWVAAERVVPGLGSRFRLQGIHKLADEQLRLAGDSDAYRRGRELAIARKAAVDQIVGLFSTAGIIALSIFCAPLGAAAIAFTTGVAGAAMSLVDVARAQEKEDRYRALERPESLGQSWQEVEMEYLMAGLSVVFSTFDAVGVAKGLRAAVGNARTALQSAARQGTRATAKEAYHDVVRNLTGEIMQEAMRQAVLEAGVTVIMEHALPHVLGPVVQALQEQSAVEHGAGFKLTPPDGSETGAP